MSLPAGLPPRGAAVRCSQLVVGALLAWAALAKLGDIPALAREIHNFRIIPVAGENLVAMVLPWIELMAALSLLLGLRARAGAVVAAGLAVIFTAAVASAVLRGLNFECGCFGTAGAMRIGSAKLIQNLAILAVAAAATLRPLRAGAESGPTRVSG